MSAATGRRLMNRSKGQVPCCHEPRVRQMTANRPPDNMFRETMDGFTHATYTRIGPALVLMHGFPE